MTTPRFTAGKLHERPLWPRARIERPFANRPTPDVSTRTYEQRYAVDRLRFAPRIAERTLGVPDKFQGNYLGPGDAADTSAYLVEETDLDPLNLRRGLIRRVFARVPAAQVVPGSRVFARPRLHDIKVGSVYAAALDDETSTLFFSRRSVSAVGDLTGGTKVEVAAEDFGVLPHWAFTISTGVGSVSPNLDSSAATIQGMIESLSGLSNVAVSATLGSLTISWEGYVAYIDTSAPGVTMSGSAGVDGSVTFTASKPGVTDTQATARPQRALTLGASHGHSPGELVVLWNGDRIVGITQALDASGDEVVIDCGEGPLAAADLQITHMAFASDGLRLVHGPKECSIKTTSNFYLPGVTTGVATAADIPATPLYADAIAWLGRILAQTLTSVSGTASSGVLTKTSHGLSTGDTFFILDKGTGLSGLATLTQYWAIKVDADTWKPASSPENARSGTAVALGSDSTGASVLVPAPWAAIGVSDLTQWIGAIMTKAVDEVQLADAIETRSPSA